MNDDNDDKIEDKIIDAYMQTFDLVDFDQSGCLDKEELMQWLTMYVLITCFHESWLFYLKKKIREKNNCLFYKKNKLYWHFIIYFDS